MVAGSLVGAKAAGARPRVGRNPGPSPSPSPSPSASAWRTWVPLRHATGGVHPPSRRGAGAAMRVVASARGRGGGRGTPDGSDGEADGLMARFRRQLDRRYLEDKVDEALKAAEDACEGEPRSKDCAIAWEEVEELQFASEKKSLANNEGNGDDPFQTSRGPTEENEASSSSSSSISASGDGDGQGVGPSLEKLRREDHLSDMNPCDIFECEEPEGTFIAAGKLERSMRPSASNGRRRTEEEQANLKSQLQDAIAEAFEECSDGDKEAECSAAWDKVDDLSFEIDKTEDEEEG